MYSSQAGNDPITPETHPAHPVVGRCYKAHDFYAGRSAVYYCDSYDPSMGYWMTLVTATPADIESSESARYRTNVSGRAIEATFHGISGDEYGYWCRWGAVRAEELGRFAGVGRYAGSPSTVVEETPNA